MFFYPVVVKTRKLCLQNYHSANLKIYFHLKNGFRFFLQFFGDHSVFYFNDHWTLSLRSPFYKEFLFVSKYLRRDLCLQPYKDDFFPCYLPYIYFQQRKFYGYYSILWRYTNLFSCNKYVNDNKRNVYCSGRRMMTMIHLNKFRPSSYLLQGSSAMPCTIWLGERKVFPEEK